MNKENLDLILVPIGLLIMIIYHLILFLRYKKFPQTTMNGYEDLCKRQWVKKMLSLEAKDRSLAVTVCNSNVTAATALSSISLVLSSLTGVWLGSSDENSIYTSSFIYGDTREAAISIKHIALLCCFLIAFACFVQTARCFVHANFLISMSDFAVPREYVEHAVITGSHFWSIGVRALYFAMTLLLWVFGPIPMIVSSVVMVAVLHKLDTNRLPVKPFEHELSDVERNLEGRVNHSN